MDAGVWEMNHNVRKTGVERLPLIKCFRFFSPYAILGLSSFIFTFGHMGASLAQYAPYSTQPAISYKFPIVATVRNWAIDVENAQRNLDANRLPDIGNARKRLDQAMSNLENFLATSPQHQANWLAFLTWNDLRKELKEEQPDQDRFMQIEKTFRQNYFGLEMQQFTRVRDALIAYSHALKYSTDRQNTIAVFSKLLNKLSEKLQMPNAVQDFESTREIGQSVALLTQGNQAMDLVNAIRGRYSRANARVLVSSEFISRRFSRPVNEANPVDELILGTQIYGQSWLEGQVTPQLIDSSTQAAMRLNLSGTFSSQSIGYNRSVKLHTQGSGSVAASETIALTDNGLIPLNDTATDAALSSQINDIEARLRLVRRIATKQAAKQKAEADSIAEGRLENRIRTQFHEKLAQQINDANQKIKTPALPVLTRLGLDRPKRTTWSSPQYLALLWKLQGTEQLGAPTSCPLAVDPTGISVQLHESVVTNLFDPILAGRILKSEELDTIATQFGDALGTGLAKKKDDEPWSVTMSPFHPVEIQLDNSMATFRIRTSKLDKGEQVLKDPATIEVDYKIVLINGAIQLERQGDVKINFSGKLSRGVNAVILRSFLKRKFEEVFKKELLDKPIGIADRLPSELQGMVLSSIQVDDGWIQAHVR